MNNIVDIEDVISDNHITIKKNTLIHDKEKQYIQDFLSDLLKIKLSNDENLNKKIYNDYFTILRRTYRINPKKSQLFWIYRQWKYK